MKTIIAVDCPMPSDQGISQFMSATRNVQGGLYDQLGARNYSVQRLSNPSLTQLEQALNSSSVAFLTASGHGTDLAFMNRQGTLLVHGMFDQMFFSRKIVHIFACSTAAILGPYLVTPDDQGSVAAAFIGYNANFNFPPDYQQTALGQQFVACDSAIDLALADGASPEDAFLAGAQAFKDLISQCQHSDPNVAALLKGDREALSLGLNNVPTATWTTGKNVP